MRPNSPKTTSITLPTINSTSGPQQLNGNASFNSLASTNNEQENSPVLTNKNVKTSKKVAEDKQEVIKEVNKLHYVYY